MMLPSDRRKPEPITAEKAAERLQRAPATIRYWVTHYNARRLGKHDRKMYYDYNDLYVIEREIYHEHPVPATWQEREEIRERCPLKAAGTFPAAA